MEQHNEINFIAPVKIYNFLICISFQYFSTKSTCNDFSSHPNHHKHGLGPFISTQSM